MANTNTKSLASAVLMLALTACSGHQIGDPTEKYGDLQRLATESTIRATQDPTIAPRVDIELAEMPASAAEGESLSFKVLVRMEAGFEDVQHQLRVTSNNGSVRFQSQLEQVTGALTYWSVTGQVAEDLLPQQEASTRVDVQFDVIFQAISNPNKAAALKGSQPSKTQALVVTRTKKRAEIIDFRSESRYEVGSSINLEVIVDSKGSDPEDLRWESKVLLSGCDAAISQCSFGSLLSVGDLEASNKNWVSTITLDLSAWSFKEGEERELQVELTLVSPNGEKDVEKKLITIFRRAELKAPEVAISPEAPAQVTQGENFEIQIQVALANSVGSLEIDEETLNSNMGEGWEGEFTCAAGTINREDCSLKGKFSCEAEVGSRQIQLVFAAVDGQKSEITSQNISLEVLQGEACHE